MALPNEFERKLIIQLRHSVKDALKDSNYISSDMLLVCWLRARDYDMKKAEMMLRESTRWRQQNKIDRILDCGLDTFFKFNYPLHLGLVDKRSRPVVILPIGKWNLKAAVKNGLSHRFRTFIIQCMEAVMKSVDNRDAMRKPCAMPITQFTAVVDFEGFEFSQVLDLKVLRSAHQILSVLESNYPETLANCICINCPLLISTSLSGLLSSVMSAKTAAKIHWYGNKQQSWKQALYKFIPKTEVHSEVFNLQQI